MLRYFVRGELLSADQDSMLQWPHSGFHVHDAVWVLDDDRAFALRLARYCARNPVALERLTYDPSAPRAEQVTYRSDKADGPTAGCETVDPLEFLARVLTHIPDKRQVMQRYYGWYANRPRGARRRRASESAGAASPVLMAEPVPLSFRGARLRWAELLRRIYEVDPLRCPQCRAEMRIVAFLIDPAVIDRILTHLRTRQARALPGKDVVSHSEGPLTSMPPLRCARTHRATARRG